MKKLILASSFTLLSAYSSFSTAMDVEYPAECVMGRSSSPIDFSVSTQDIKNTMAATDGDSETTPDGEALYEFIKRILEVFDTASYVRIEGPDHMLKGQPSRFKANLFDPLRFARFHSIDQGFVGKDKSNLEANAYHNITFDKVGAKMVWVTSDGRCSAKGVWVQSAPSIRPRDYGVRNNNGEENTAEVSVYFHLPTYSKLAVSKKNPNIVLKWVNESGVSGSKVVTARRTFFGRGFEPVTTTMNNVSGGFVRFSATIFDGKYHASAFLGEIHIPGKRTKKPCETGVGGKRCHIDI